MAILGGWAFLMSEVVLISVSGVIACARPSEQGRVLACPASVSIAPAPMTTQGRDLAGPASVSIAPVPMTTVGTLLSAKVVPFPLVTSESHMCRYAECPHSRVVSAENFITVTFKTPTDLPAGTVLTISGLVGAPAAANVVATLGNINRLSAGTAVSLAANCSCITEACTCEPTP
ncbi:hypothetical protein T484DRAFT_1797878 [Baffinella frigidus]|nr:hypothetical protein T484DRAFT_1797878 [Cryptophyta sp. CCMP2293]